MLLEAAAVRHQERSTSRVERFLGLLESTAGASCSPMTASIHADDRLLRIGRAAKPLDSASVILRTFHTANDIVKTTLLALRLFSVSLPMVHLTPKYLQIYASRIFCLSGFQPVLRESGTRTAKPFRGPWNDWFRDPFLAAPAGAYPEPRPLASHRNWRSVSCC